MDPSLDGHAASGCFEYIQEGKKKKINLFFLWLERL